MVRLVLLITSMAVSICGLSISVSYATDTTVFRVDSYIPQYFKDFELQTTGGLGLSGNDHSRTGSDPSEWLRSESDSRYREGAASAIGRYQQRTMQRYVDAQLSLGGSASSCSESANTAWPASEVSDSSYDRYHNSSYAIALSQRGETGLYIAGDLFLAVTANVTARYSRNLSAERDTYSRGFEDRVVNGDTVVEGWYQWATGNTDWDAKAYSAALDVRTGWGRIYDGSYAVTAMELTNILRKAGLITREPSYGEMMGLTETIHQNRQTHAVDSRLHRINALTEMLTQLADAGVVADPGPYGFALVEDVWDYYPRSKRQFGWKISARAGVSYEYSSSQLGIQNCFHTVHTEFRTNHPDVVDTVSSDDTWVRRFEHDRTEGSRPYLEWQFEYAKPLDPRWQAECAVTGSHYLGGHVNRDVGGGGHYSKDWPGSHQIAADILCAYYYDTRTAGGLTLSYETGTAHAPGSYWGTLKTEKRWVFSIGGDVTYRLSVPTSMQLRAGWSKEHDLYAETVSSYNLSAGITHWLF
jgi:hypothetical protein